MSLHYSIIQLQPEAHRLERVNIGVLLWEESPNTIPAIYVHLPDYGFYRLKYAYPWIGRKIYRDMCEREVQKFVKDSQPNLISSIYAQKHISSPYTKIFYRQPMPIVISNATEIDDYIEILLNEFIYVPGIAPSIAKIL